MVVKYTGHFTTRTAHPAGESVVLTQAHPEEGEKVFTYNPVELICLAGAACVESMIGVAAKTHGFSVDGMETHVSFDVLENPLRLKSMNMEIHIPGGALTDKDKRFITAATKTCPVLLSLNESVEKNITFIYE